MSPKIVFTNGCFDVIHAGHIKLLREAKQQGDYLIVGLNSDRSVRELKGPTRPINNEVDRFTVLSAIRYVDHVVMFDGDDLHDLIESLRPAIYVKGGDYKKEDLKSTPIVERYGGKVVIIPLKEGLSSSNIIAQSAASDFNDVHK